MSEWERREVVSCMFIRHKAEIKVVDFAHASSRAQRKMCKRSNPPRSNRELSWTNLDCQGGRKGLPACGTAGRMCRVSGSENGLVRLAGGWWLRLIYCERKILLTGWWLVAGAELV
jgi:hypothetical protein